MKNILFIDESGDEGLENFRSEGNSGASPLFFLGAALVQENKIDLLSKEISNCETIIGNIHFSKISHDKKVFFLKKIQNHDFKCFGLISSKKDLRDYKKGLTPEKFYNKNVKYLFEIIGKYCANNGIKVDKIIFDKKNSKNYITLRNFLNIVTFNPIYPQSRYLEYLDINSIDAKSQKEELLLRIPDSVANSLYRSCLQNDLGLTETKYLLEILPKFHSNSSGEILGHGIKIIPNWSKLNIAKEDSEFLNNLRKIV